MTWCRYHCRRGESHFTSLEAFDAHHGSEPGTFPDGIDFVETAGTCRIGDPTRAITGTVCSTERAFPAVLTTSTPSTALRQRGPSPNARVWRWLAPAEPSRPP